MISEYIRRFLHAVAAIAVCMVPVSKAHAQIFSQITTSSMVNDLGDSQTPSWTDYDGDGDLDLYVTNGFSVTAQPNFLYRNEGDGNFVRMMFGNIVTDVFASSYSGWADYNNDGHPDLFVSNAFGSNNQLFKNDGNGAFSPITSGVIGNDGGNARSCSWGDYDNDGDLDLFVGNSLGENNNLYRNEMGDLFVKMFLGTVGSDGGITIGSNWLDYDNDGDLDLYAVNGGSGAGAANFLYQNLLIENGSPGFQRNLTGAVANDAESSLGTNWVDYDNDGLLDIYVTNFFGNNSLYRNLGDGTFSKISGEPMVSDGLSSRSSAWADYDLDGDLDLFVTHSGSPSSLYRNESGGSFVQVFDEVVDNVSMPSIGASFADYDNDGDPDLFVCVNGNLNNLLYRNDLNNGNHWLHVICKGTSSNRSAIGARVRVKAGHWQVRFISGITGYYGQNSPRAEFGLGTAAVVDSLVVEWPSGAEDVFTNLTADEIVTATEGGILTTVETSPDIPQHARLLRNYPNPFNPSTRIEFEVNSAGPVSLVIYNILGQAVRTLIDVPGLGDGRHVLTWNGQSDAGLDVASGTYVYRLDADGVIISRKMVLIR